MQQGCVGCVQASPLVLTYTSSSIAARLPTPHTPAPNRLDRASSLRRFPSMPKLAPNLGAGQVAQPEDACTVMFAFKDERHPDAGCVPVAGCCMPPASTLHADRSR